MKHAVWLAVGIVVAVAAWVPLNIDPDPRDIPVGAVILGVLGTVVGGVIALVALVRLVRRLSRAA